MRDAGQSGDGPAVLGPVLVGDDQQLLFAEVVRLRLGEDRPGPDRLVFIFEKRAQMLRVGI
ncbi:hypothetical protein ACWGK1_33395, partial [Streptomyces wedmorensis]